MWKVLSQWIHMCNMKALSLKVWKLWPRLKFFKSRSNFKVKIYGTMWKVLSQGIHMCNMKASSLLVWKLWSRLKFLCHLRSIATHSLKVGQTSRSRSRGQHLWYHVKGLVTRNKHMKYESFIFNGLKIMGKVKVFVYAANADADMDTDADGRAMTLAPRTFVPAR